MLRSAGAGLAVFEGLVLRSLLEKEAQTFLELRGSVACALDERYADALIVFREILKVLPGLRVFS